MLPKGVTLGLSYWMKALEKTCNILEGLYLPGGLGMSRVSQE